MSLEDLKAILDQSGISFTYHHWEREKHPPYGVYLYVYENQFYADGKLYYWTGHYQVELYTRQKDPAMEKRVETALALAGIVFEKSEMYLESEKLYEILYEIEV